MDNPLRDEGVQRLLLVTLHAFGLLTLLRHFERSLPRPRPSTFVVHLRVLIVIVIDSEPSPSSVSPRWGRSSPFFLLRGEGEGGVLPAASWTWRRGPVRPSLIPVTRSPLPPECAVDETHYCDDEKDYGED